MLCGCLYATIDVICRQSDLGSSYNLNQLMVRIFTVTALGTYDRTEVYKWAEAIHLHQCYYSLGPWQRWKLRHPSQRQKWQQQITSEFAATFMANTATPE